MARLSLARFALSLPTAKSYGAVDLARRICAKIASFKAKLRGEDIKITISIGVYVPEKGSRPDYESVYEGAQRALKTALSQGANQVFAIMPNESEAEQERPREIPGSLSIMSVDKALAQIAEGDLEAVRLKLPLLISKLKPLINIMNEAQKVELIELLTRQP